MKRSLLFAIAQLLLFSCVFADSELVVALTNTGPTTNPNDLGRLAPCISPLFQVNYTIPTGYTNAKQFDWYANNVLVATIANPNNQARVRITADDFVVTCKVTYINATNGMYQPHILQQLSRWR